MKINWKKYRDKAVNYAIEWGVEFMWEWIKKMAVKVFKGAKKVLVSDMAKSKIKDLWDEYDNFEDFWEGYKRFVNKV